MTAAREFLRSVATTTNMPESGIPALTLRQSILETGNEFVELDSLIAVLANHGIHVLRTSVKNDRPLAGLAVTFGGRAVVVLPLHHNSPSRMACDLAHLAGHVCLGHLGENEVVGDIAISWKNRPSGIEREANDFAMMLLTGKPNMSFSATLYRDHMLADWAKKQSAKHRIEPAIVVQLYARHTGKYSLANRACKAFEGNAE